MQVLPIIPYSQLSNLLSMGLNLCIEMILRSYLEILLFMFIFLFVHIIFRKNNALPMNWPVFGMLPHILSHLNHIHDYVVKLLHGVGMSFMFRGPWFAGMDMFVTCDPDNVNHVFNTHGKLYGKGDDLTEMFGALGDCLLTTEGEKWKGHRRAMHRIMANGKFQEYELQVTSTKVKSCLIPILERCAEENKVMDLQDVFLRLIFDTVCATYFGVDPGCLHYDFPAVPFAKALETLEEIIFYEHLFPKIIAKLLKILNVGYMKKLAVATQIMDQFIEQIFEEKIALIQKENEQERGTSSPADAPYNRDKSLPVESEELQKSVKSNAKNILLAATDTTGAALAWFFWLLSENPDVENKIINELQKILPIQENSTQKIMFDKGNLQKLVYLHGAICESLRLYPPIPFQHKSASQTDVLPSGHRVKPGTFLLFHSYSMGRMASVWGEDCMDFKPERWINRKGEIVNEPAYKFFTFNCGPRICLGKEMAINKMKIVICAVIRNFHVEVVRGHVVEPKLGILLHMKNGLMVKVRKREWF